MDVPVDLSLGRKLCIFDGEYFPGYPRGEGDVDKVIGKKGPQDFVDVEWECYQPSVIGERLNGLAQPRYWGDWKRIVHREVGGGGGGG